ncbi:MAG: GNAT family N-acetyltransferase [Actinobacteria bacterium]|nr:GNAT family N-acetyltransferase [Actinomycetota bacterium]
METERLLLRQWRDEDLEPFAAMNTDPEVMEFFPSVSDRADSDKAAEMNGVHIAEHGWGLWAVEVGATGDFVGFTGLWSVPAAEFPFAPAVEVGWRLARPHWGQGYATEAARAAVAFGFDELRLDEIVSMTAVGNLRSRRVMEKLGMTTDPTENFEHPRVPDGHPLRPHVLYRIARPSEAAPN